MNLLYIALAFLGGAVTPIQAGLNRTLGGVLGSPLHATFANFLVGLLAASAAMLGLAVAGVIRLPANFAQSSWWMWLGGLCGVTLVFCSAVAVEKLGYAGLIVCVVAGQLVVSVVLDHFGVLTPVRAVNPTRLLGMGLLVVGVVLVQRG